MLKIVHVETNYETQESDALVQDITTGELKILPWGGPEVQEALREHKKRHGLEYSFGEGYYEVE